MRRIYIPKRNKVVVLLSSSHAGNEILSANANKPRVILDYNAGKKGVEQMNKNTLTVHMQTVDSSVAAPGLFYILDVASFNAYLTCIGAMDPLQRAKNF